LFCFLFGCFRFLAALEAGRAERFLARQVPLTHYSGQSRRLPDFGFCFHIFLLLLVVRELPIMNLQF
jgi:hypothetical protein